MMNGVTARAGRGDTLEQGQPGAGKVRVLEAALHVFHTKGYTATTVDDPLRGARPDEGHGLS